MLLTQSQSHSPLTKTTLNLRLTSRQIPLHIPQRLTRLLTITPHLANGGKTQLSYSPIPLKRGISVDIKKLIELKIVPVPLITDENDSN